MRCPLVAGLLFILCLSTVSAQTVKVEYYPCDPEDAIDLEAPALQSVMLQVGFVPETGEGKTPFKSLLEQLSEKPPTPIAFAVRVTNTGTSVLTLKPENLVTQEGKWSDSGANFDKPEKELKASAEFTSYAGSKSLFAKGESLAAGKAALGIVMFEAQGESDAPRRVTYSAAGIKVELVSRKLEVLDAVGIKLSATGGATAPPPPSGGKPKIFGAAGNTDDATPTKLGKPGAIVWSSKAVEANSNIATEQTMSGGMGGGMMGGMGGGMMGPGMGMGGMGGGMMGPGMMPGAGGGMMGPGMMPGAGGGMMGPGMMPGAGGGMMGPGMMGPGMMGGQQGGGAAVMPGMPNAGATTPARPTRPRKPAASDE